MRVVTGFKPPESTDWINPHREDISINTLLAAILVIHANKAGTEETDALLISINDSLGIMKQLAFINFQGYSESPKVSISYWQWITFPDVEHPVLQNHCSVF